MPQGKRGQGSAERRGKRSLRTTAKKVNPVKPAKRLVAKAVAKPVAKRKVAEPVVKPAAKHKAKKPVVKPAAKGNVAKPTVKAVAKRRVAKAAITPMKKRKADSVANAAIERVAEPAAEPVVELWIADTEFAPVVAEWIAEPVVVPVTEDWFAQPAVEPVTEDWVANPAGPMVEDWVASPLAPLEKLEPPALAVEPRVAELAEAEAVAESVVECEVGESTSSAGKSFVERRKSIKSLFERRLADPSAKERRAPNSWANEPRLANPAPTARVTVGPAAAGVAEIAAKEDVVAGSPAAKPVVERRVADRRARRGEENFAEEMRAREQQTWLHETATWMRKGGAVLIGLNVLTVIAVVLLGRVHVSQLKEMQKATAASGDAAYAACLGTQTARNMLLELKAERTAPHDLAPAAAPSAIVPPAVAPTRAQAAQAAQIAFDMEKTTSVNPHIPVLFHFAVHNVGATPAMNVKVWGAVKVLDAGEQPKFEYGEASLKKAAISPNEPAAKVITYTEDAGNVVPMSDDEFERVNSGAAYVVAYGRAVYQDAFGVRHWAVFCRDITEPAAGKRSSKCAAYNGAGDSEVTDKPAEKAAETVTATGLQRGSQNASVTLPEIACEVPKEEKY